MAKIDTVMRLSEACSEFLSESEQDWEGFCEHILGEFLAQADNSALNLFATYMAQFKD